MGELMNEFSTLCWICNEQREDFDEDHSHVVCDGCDFEVVHYQCLGEHCVPEYDVFCPPCKEQRKKSMTAERE